MQRRVSALVALVAVGMLASQTAAARVVRRGAESPAEQIAAAMRAYAAALTAGPSGVDTLANAYASDGELLEPGMQPLRGPEAIRAFLGPLAAQVRVREARMESDAIEVYGRVGYQWGQYWQTVEVGGAAPAHFTGRYVAQWQRAKNGRWLLRRLMVQPFPQREGVIVPPAAPN